MCPFISVMLFWFSISPVFSVFSPLLSYIHWDIKVFFSYSIFSFYTSIFCSFSGYLEILTCVTACRCGQYLSLLILQHKDPRMYSFIAVLTPKSCLFLHHSASPPFIIFVHTSPPSQTGIQLSRTSQHSHCTCTSAAAPTGSARSSWDYQGDWMFFPVFITHLYFLLHEFLVHLLTICFVFKVNICLWFLSCVIPFCFRVIGTFLPHSSIFVLSHFINLIHLVEHIFV